MDALLIESTEFTPRIKFDPDNRIFEFEGVSRPENVSVFYEPVIDWMTDYESELYKINVSGGKKFDIKVIFKLSYFNSASAKMIFILLESLVRIRNMGFEFNIDWFYEDGDDQMLDDGHELSEAIDISFNFFAS